MLLRFFGLLLIMSLAQNANAQNARADWKLAPVSSTKKLLAKTPGQLEPFKPEPVQLRAARGEWENFQFVVTAGAEPIRELQIKTNTLATVLGEFLAPGNFQIYRENYVFVAKPSGNRELEPKWWPDALIPLDLASKRIEAGESAVFWVSLFVPNNAAPGDYFGELDLLADNQPRRLALGLKVENAPMPAPTFRGTVALYYDVLRDWYAKNASKTYSDAEWNSQKRRYYDFLLEYRINAYDLPVAWNSPEADAILRDSRVLSVRVPPAENPDFSFALEKLRSTKTLKKSFSYWIDEPAPARFAEVRETTKKLRALGVKHLVTVHPNDALKDSVDIWCPNIGDFFGVGHLDLKALEAERKRGRETWIYTMVEPKFPYPTWLVDDSASSISAYASLWARGGFSGFVYSMCHGWGPKPLENLGSFAATNGDGTLLYPAELVGGEGPMPSIRLMLLRDAIENWELINAARQLSNSDFTRDAALDALASSSTKPKPKPRFVAPDFWPFAAPPKLELKVPVVSAAPKLDGLLSDSIWNRRSQIAAKFGRAFIDEENLSSTNLWLARDARFLYVAFKAQNPREGDWFAVELAPADLEKQTGRWRFVATLKGNLIAEKHTREGQNRVEILEFRAVVKRFANFANVEMRIPLDELSLGPKFRFGALRRTSAGAANTKVTLRAFVDAGDSRRLPVVSSR